VLDSSPIELQIKYPLLPRKERIKFKLECRVMRHLNHIPGIIGKNLFNSFDILNCLVFDSVLSMQILNIPFKKKKSTRDKIEQRSY